MVRGQRTAELGPGCELQDSVALELGPAAREHGPRAPGPKKRPRSLAAPALARFHTVNVRQNSFDPHPTPGGEKRAPLNYHRCTHPKMFHVKHNPT